MELEYRNINATMRSHNICVLVPTYNNAGTVADVVNEILNYTSHVIVVNDGSTDNTAEILAAFGNKIQLVTYKENQGKGTALKRGFKKAVELGYDYAITIDSDGQHYPSDIPLFVKAIVENPGCIIIGERDLSNVDINVKSSFANKFSNFWFAVQTGRRLNDTQTGFRAYPLKNMYGLSLLTSRYEAELELLVFAAWNGVDIIPIPIRVYYPPQSQRVSHFRPTLDFTRISILNTVLCFGAVLYGLPARFINCIKHRKFFRNEFKPFVYKTGKPREASVTIGRIFRSLYALSHFIFWSLFVFKPFVGLNFNLTAPDERKRLRLHRMLQRISVFFSKNFPGGKVRFENPHNESFSKPAMIIANHQSHLDLPIIMSVHEKLIFLTNDWVWNNRFFGDIIHQAEFIPVSSGIETILPHLKNLTARGFSIVVFPEGTRSADCSILRFHQGAFHLANELELDIVPMVIHGAGHYLPKNDFLLRKNPQTLRILKRIPYGTFGDMLLRKQASAYRKLITDEYNIMSRDIEKPSYFKSLVLYKYAWRGFDTVAKCKHILSCLPDFEHLISGLDGNIYFLNAGIGVIPLLCALANKHANIYAFVENSREYQIFSTTAKLPENLHIIHAIWDDDYKIIPAGSKNFVIQSENLMQRFSALSPVHIPLES